MSSLFPAAIDTFTDTFNDMTDQAGVHATAHNKLADAVAALETSLINGMPLKDKGGEFFNVKAYGAKGDGVTDDTAAIQAAINAAGAVRGMVLVPPGFYIVNPDGGGYCLYMDTYDYTGIVGSGDGRQFGSVLRCNTSAFTGLLSIGAHNSTARIGVRISNLGLQAGDGSAAYGSGYLGIGIDSRGSGCLFDHLGLQYFGGAYMIGIRAPGATSVFDNVLSDVYLYQPGSDSTDGVYIAGDSGSVTDSELILVKADGVKRQVGTGNGGRYAFNINGGVGGTVQSVGFYECHPYFWQNCGYFYTTPLHTIITGGQCETNGSGGANDGGIVMTGGGGDIDIGGLELYANLPKDIQVLGNGINRFNIHDNLWSLARPGATNNIYIAGAGGGTAGPGRVAGNQMLLFGASAPVANVELGTGSINVVVQTNYADVALKETGTTTGTRGNVFDDWNLAPAGGITKVDASTVITMDNYGVGRGTPGAAAGANAGTSPPAPVVGSGANNHRGTLTFGTGTTPAAGAMVAVTFSAALPYTPQQITLSWSNAAGAGLGQAYLTSVSASGFTINCTTAPAASQTNATYSVGYRVEL